MRIGIHRASGGHSAAIFAQQLLRALHRRLGPSDSLIAFDGRRAQPHLRPPHPQAIEADEFDLEARAPGRVAACLAGLCADRAHARYSREVDVSHSIGGAPSGGSASAVVPLVPDLGPVQFPRRHSAAETRQMERFLAQIEQYAAVSTVSEYTRRELAELSGLDASRIRVIQPGVDELFRAPGRPEDEYELQALGLLPQQFFLNVGAVDEHHNLPTLLTGYAALPQRVKAWLPLVVVGGRGRGGPSVPASAQPDIDAGNIRLLGNVPVFLLRLLYRNARMAMFPSDYGGFGLSLAEALVCGAPVAVSRDTALAEMAGPLAVLVDAPDALQWRDAFADQVDRGTHGRLERRAAALANAFTWDQAAEQAMDLYEQAVLPASARFVPVSDGYRSMSAPH